MATLSCLSKLAYMWQVMVIGRVTCLGLVRKTQEKVVAIIFEVSALSADCLCCHTVPLQMSKLYLLALSTPQLALPTKIWAEVLSF